MSIEDKVNALMRATELRLLSLDEFCQPPAAMWLVRGLIPASGIVVVFGAPKSGKSCVVGDMTMHFAHGMHWRGHCVSRAIRVAYFAGEGQNGLKVRLHAWRSEHAPERTGEYKLLPISLSLPDRREELLVLLREYRADIVVVDTLNTFFGGLDENSTGDMTAFVAALRELIDGLGCAVVVIHHTGLADPSRARGSTVLRASADVIAQVVKDERVKGLVGFQVIEGRDTETWDEPLSLQLNPVEVDWRDDDGKPMRTCVVESTNDRVRARGRRSEAFTPAEQRAIAAVEKVAKARANGASTVELRFADVAAASPEINRTSFYRVLRAVAPRMRWEVVGTVVSVPV